MDLTKPIRTPVGGGGGGSGVGATKPQPAAPPPGAGAGKPAVRGFDSMFSPSHFVNGVRVNKAPY